MSISPLQLAVFASGSGSNLEAILLAIEAGSLPHVTVAAVISNKKDARALKRAQSRNIPTAVLSPNDYARESDYLEALEAILNEHEINFIALAGYLKKIPLPLVKKYAGRMLNIHPSLLPAFGGPGMYGSKIHTAAITRGVRWTGVTVHLVDEEYDTGPILLQKTVPVHQSDTPETLAQRVLAVEHHIYPEALRLFAEGRVTVENRKVFIDPNIPKGISH
ncbi:MAG: phosphoribosylglycinamide formyltransferase [Rhodothermales bacterium]